MMGTRRVVLMLLCVLTRLLIPTVAAASTVPCAGTSDVVRTLAQEIRFGDATPAILDLHRGYELAEYDSASDSVLAARGGGQKLLPEQAGPTGHISPGEVSGRTPSQIDARARELGLDPKGPDPMGGRGSYVDPQTGKQRILSHPNADPPHGHVNDPEGRRIGADGRNVPPESPEAHLPIKND